MERQRGPFVVSERERNIIAAPGPIAAAPAGGSYRRAARRLPGQSSITNPVSAGCRTGWRAPGQAPVAALRRGGGVAAALACAAAPRDCKFVGLGRVEAAPGIGTDIAKLVQGRMAVTDWDSLNEGWRQNPSAWRGSFSPAMRR